MGQPTKDHAVMRELTRVRQYVAKIKEAEPAAPPALSLDKAAAGRFIAAALAGNDKYDEERAATIARERAGAEAKLKALDEKRKRGEGSEESEKVTKKSKKEETGEEEVKKKKKKTKRSKEEKEARREERRGSFVPSIAAPILFLWLTPAAEKRKDVRKKQMSAS
jgi:exosome complex protein LRP1